MPELLYQIVGKGYLKANISGFARVNITYRARKPTILTQIIRNMLMRRSSAIF